MIDCIITDADSMSGSMHRGPGPPNLRSVSYNMRSIRNFFHNINDILLAIIIVVIAAGVIYWRMGIILDYPKQLAAEQAAYELENEGASDAEDAEAADAEEASDEAAGEDGEDAEDAEEGSAEDAEDSEEGSDDSEPKG